MVADIIYNNAHKFFSDIASYSKIYISMSDLNNLL